MSKICPLILKPLEILNRWMRESQKYLLKYAKTPEEEEGPRKNTSLWPLTGQVVTIAMLNPDTAKGRFLSGADGKAKDFSEDGVDYVVGDEKILERFWQTIKSFDHYNIQWPGHGTVHI